MNKQPDPVVTNKRMKWIVMAVVTLIAAGLISYFASPHPDGLERVAANHGFIDRAKQPSWSAWIPDYEFPGIHSAYVRVGLAGVIGVATLFGVLYALTKPLARREEVESHGEGDHHSS
ncbi:PDGLE domain-containing protein [Cohnella mopanensis]|uniref:PDGLE domain-containing protein n=1 Tax=Cohnella mopanensis TaxID=2911966 RepID=UPI001EF8282A|nr:PDGLE domain-containing protein [Cohnella mopanensis]